MPELATDLKAPNRMKDAEQFARRRLCCDDVRASVSRAEFLSHNSRCSVKFSSARGGGEGAEAHDLHPARCLARVGVGEGAGTRDQQSGVVAMCSSARVGVGEGAEVYSSTDFGRPGALLGSSVAFGSGCG